MVKNKQDNSDMETKPDIVLISNDDSKERVILHSESIMYLYSAMTWPNDKSRIKQYTAASIENVINTNGDFEKASIWCDVEKERKKALWGGFVTGKVFYLRLIGCPLGKAWHTIAKELNGGCFNGQKQRLSAESARDHWYKYMNAAHLWTAFAMLEKDKEYKEHEYNTLLVQMSEKLLECAKDRNITFQDWKPIIITTDVEPTFELNIPEITSENIEELSKDYTPRYQR